MFLKGSLVSPYFGIFSYLRNIFENIFNFRLRIFSLTCEKFRILGQIWGKLTFFWHSRIYFSLDQNALRIFCKLRTFSLLNSSQKIKNTSGWFYKLIFLKIISVSVTPWSSGICEFTRTFREFVYLPFQPGIRVLPEILESCWGVGGVI